MSMWRDRLREWWREVIEDIARVEMSHEDMVGRLRVVMTHDPLPPPRVLWPKPDGRERSR